MCDERNKSITFTMPLLTFSSTNSFNSFQQLFIINNPTCVEYLISEKGTFKNSIYGLALGN